MHNHTTHPIKHSQAFNLSTLTKLFTKWGSSLTLKHLQVKLITLLCVLGVLHMSAVILPHFRDVHMTSSEGVNALMVLVISYKNNKYSKGNTITIYQCSNQLLCPITTFREWQRHTAHLHNQIHNCRIVFKTSPPYKGLNPHEDHFSVTGRPTD
jgi:hypothetical protein